ncbi:type VII secretion protein EccB [Actinokineospora sp. 24-640]
MYGRREQVEAHSFLAGRLTAALLRTDPDAPDRPLRRTTGGVLGGAAIGALVAAGVVVFGLLTGKGGADWTAPGVLVVDSDTGNRYLYVDGTLHPVLNYASARLLLGEAPKVVRVGGDELAGLPKGAPAGILGAPDTLPAAGAAPAWTVCAQPGGRVGLTVGDLPGAAVVPDGQALLVRAGDETHLAWRDRRFRVAAAWVPRALGFDPAAATSVDPVWLNALAAGPDLGAPPLARGGNGPVVGGLPTVLGQIVTVPDAVGPTTYAVTAGGLVPVTETAAALLAADPAGPDAPRLRVSPAELAAQTVLPAPDWQAQWPPAPPRPVAADGAPCVRWAGESAVLTVATGPGRAPVGDPPAAIRDAGTADVVAVGPGAGVLARTRPAPGVPGAGLYLVTEAGAKYPVGSADAAAALGLPADSAAPVPADLLDLLPTGPLLDRSQPST